MWVACLWGSPKWNLRSKQEKSIQASGWPVGTLARGSDKQQADFEYHQRMMNQRLEAPIRTCLSNHSKVKKKNKNTTPTTSTNKNNNHHHHQRNWHHSSKSYSALQSHHKIIQTPFWLKPCTLRSDLFEIGSKNIPNHPRVSSLPVALRAQKVRRRRSPLASAAATAFLWLACKGLVIIVVL